MKAIVCNPNIKKTIQKHFVEDEGQGNLAEKLKKAGATANQASEIVKDIGKKISKKTKLEQLKIVNNLLKNSRIVKNKKNQELFVNLINNQLQFGIHTTGLKNKISEALGLPTLKADDVRAIKNLTSKIREAKASGKANLAQALTQQLERNILNSGKSTIQEKIQLYRYFNMLTAIGTASVNFSSNEMELLGKLVSDSIATKSLNPLRLFARQGEVLKDLTWGNIEGKKLNMRERWEMVSKSGLKRREADTLESVWGTGRKKIFKNNIGDLMETSLTYGLELPDRIVRNTALVSSYLRQLNNAGVKVPEFKTDKEMTDYLKRLDEGKIAGISKDRIEEIKLVADWEAAKTVFQDENAWSRAMVETRMYFNKISGEMKLGDVLFPFVGVPANIAKLAVDRSEIGSIINLFHFAMNKAGKYSSLEPKYVQNAKVAQNLINSLSSVVGMGTAGFMLSAMGGIRPDDRGIQTIKLSNGEYLDVGLLNLIMGPAQFAADLQQGRIKNLNDYVKSFVNRTKPILDLPVFGLANTAVKSYRDATKRRGKTGEEEPILAFPKEFGKNLAINYVRTLLPLSNMAGQVSKVMQGETMKDTYDPDTIKQFIKQIKNIYGLRGNLEDKIDTRGQVVKRKADPFTKAIEMTRLARYKDKKTIDDPVFKEKRKIGLSGNLKYAPTEYRIEGKTIKLNDKERGDFQRQVGQSTYSALKNLINSKQYTNLSIDDKQKMINKIENRYMNETKKQFMRRRMQNANN